MTMSQATFAKVRRVLIGSLAALAAISAAGAPAQEPMTAEAPQDAIFKRPTDVTLIMSTSHGKYDGTYQRSEVSQICGEQSAEMSLSGGKVFLVQFPDSLEQQEINDVNFGSAALVGGVTSTSKFYVTVGVVPKSGGRPPGYVLDTTHPDNTGTAALAVTGGTTQLKVDGVNDRGETINLTVVCKPRKR